VELRLQKVSNAGMAVGRAIAALPREVARRGLPLIGGAEAAGAPDRRVALEQYRRLASVYDLSTAAGAPYRWRTVERLAPAAGEVVVDVGCGTGLNFAAIEEGIGAEGRLIGLDPCAEMLERSRDRVAAHGWRNVELVHAAAEDAELGVMVDAAILCGVHDVMRSPEALANVVRHVRAGGRIVAGGAKWAPWWRPGGAPLNVSTWAMNRDYVTTLEGFDRPWSRLAELVPRLQVEEVYFGGGYIAWGRRNEESRPTSCEDPTVR
jgi:SAM-dependent methyltransferase